MKIQVNGEPVEVAEGASIKEVLNQLQFGEKPVVVEHNRQALFPREHSEVIVQEGDLVEIVQITAGG